MKGHESLIAMRKSGYKPPIIFMADEGSDPQWEWKKLAPDIHIGDEKPFHADLRFIIGLAVSIDCRSKERAKQFFENAKKRKPYLLTCGFYKNNKDCLWMFWSGDVEYIEEDGNVKFDSRRHRF